MRFYWYSRLSLREMDQQFKYGGTIIYGDSYLEFLFRHFKVFRLQAILHDAAAALRANSGKGPGYCYMIERGPIHVCSVRDRITLLPLRKNLSALHFQFCRFLKQYVFDCTRYTANKEKHN